MSHLLKYKDFYEDNGLKFELGFMDIPTANGIDSMCDNPKRCDYSCHSGVPCELFKPNERFEKFKAKEGLDPNEVDYNKDYFKVEKNPQELRIEALEARIDKLERKKS